MFKFKHVKCYKFTLVMLYAVLMIGAIGCGEYEEEYSPEDIQEDVQEDIQEVFSVNVYSVAFSPDGETLASGSGDLANDANNTVRLWDVSTGTEIQVLTGHTDAVRSVAFSPDGQTLASGSMDGTIRLWDVSTGTEIHVLFDEFRLPIYSVAFSPDGQTLASGIWQGVDLWDVSTGTEKYALYAHDTGYSVAFSPDGETLASGSGNYYGSTNHIFNQIFLWDMSTDRETLEDGLWTDGLWEKWRDWNKGWDNALTGHTGWVSSVAFSPDGETLASGSRDETIRLWDVPTGTEIQVLTGHTSWVLSVAFSPDGQTLASGSWDNTVRLWDVPTGTEIQVLTGHTAVVRSVAFSPDGQTLASGSGDNTVRLWDVSTGTEIRRLFSS